METRNGLSEPTRDSCTHTLNSTLSQGQKRTLFGFIFGITDDSTAGEQAEPDSHWLATVYNISASKFTRACSSVASAVGSVFGGKSLDLHSFESLITQGIPPKEYEVQSMLEDLLAKGHLSQFLSTLDAITTHYPSLCSILFPQLLETGVRFPAQSSFVDEATKKLLPHVDRAPSLHAACTFQYPGPCLELLEKCDLEHKQTKDAVGSLFDLLAEEKLDPKMDPVLRHFGQKFVQAKLIEREEENLIYAFVIGAEKLLELDDGQKRAAERFLHQCLDPSRTGDMPSTQSTSVSTPSEWFASALQTTFWLSTLSNAPQRESTKFETVNLALLQRQDSRTRRNHDICFQSIREALSHKPPSSDDLHCLLRHFLDFFTPRPTIEGQIEPKWDYIKDLLRLFAENKKNKLLPVYQKIFSALLVLPFHDFEKLTTQERAEKTQIVNNAEKLAISMVEEGLIPINNKIDLLGCAPIHLAPQLGYWKLTEKLLKYRSIDVMTPDDDGHTPFYYLNSHRKEASTDPKLPLIINKLAERMAHRHQDAELWKDPMALFDAVCREMKGKRTSLRDVKEWYEGFEKGSLSCFQAIYYLPDLLRHEYWKVNTNPTKD